MMTARLDSVFPVTARSLYLHRGGRDLLNIDRLEFRKSGCTVIVGPNGAGKSLLVRTLCGLQAPDRGDILWAGRPPDSARRHQVGLLLQRPVLLMRSALANLQYVLRQRGLNRRESTHRATVALEQASLIDVAEAPAKRLSGGEQQRLALARALLFEPEVLFLDEATANVDPASTLHIEQQLRQAIESGLSVVMVSHDIGQVRRMADRVLLMHLGQVVEHCERHHFFEQSTNPETRRWIDGELLV